MKKGFTLVELLAVIVIIAMVYIIVVPAVTEMIANSRKDLYDAQMLDIQSAAKSWATDNNDLLDPYHVNDVYISLDSIKKSGYLEKDEIKNPMTKEAMDGCVLVKYNFNSQQYNYTYEEKLCDDYAQTISKNSGYIIYDYNTQTQTFDKDASSNEYQPAGLAIYNYYVENNLLKVDGEVLSGDTGSLFETEDEYVFRGENPNNYVTLQGTDKNSSWRILSINKKDYSLKLISTSSVSNQWDSNGGILFNTATSNVNILANYDYSSDKIINYDYKTNVVNFGNFSVNALNTALKENSTSLKIGLISVLDYVNASATYDCSVNYMSSNCKNNNYLYKMFGTTNSTWTLNSNSSQIWYVDTTGELKVESPDKTKNLYSVVKLNTGVYIINADKAVGSSTTPYLIK